MYACMYTLGHSSQSHACETGAYADEYFVSMRTVPK